MGKLPRVSDKEIDKWTKILGVNRFIYLYIDGRIFLTSKQLDRVIAIKNQLETTGSETKKEVTEPPIEG